MKKLFKVLFVFAMIITIVWLGIANKSKSREIEHLEEIKKQYEDIYLSSIGTNPSETITPSPSDIPKTDKEDCSSCKELERDLESTNQKIEFLEDSLDVANKLLASLGNKFDETDKDDKKDESVSDNSEEIQKLKDELNSANAKIEKLEKEKETIQKNLDDVKKENKTLNSANESLKKENSQSENSKQELKNVKQELENAKQEAEKYKMYWTEIENQRVELVKILDESNSQINELSDQLAIEQQKVKNLEQMVENEFDEDTYMLIKFPEDGYNYMTTNKVTFYYDPTCTQKIDFDYWNNSFRSSKIDYDYAENGLPIYCLRMDNGMLVYCPQSKDRPYLVTVEEFWERVNEWEWLLKEY